ncbi:LAMI_0E15236g1_1 [Lachancea mirantina]|uniref:LAMI_0E15236g1_1 n=1 Tax=Lachancea mirantina TaxID=1230905 RepID=A0A1G4JS92_9SACH|nr:LAMI_0E15236g1_1 [Lachancea mirantina]
MQDYVPQNLAALSDENSSMPSIAAGKVDAHHTLKPRYLEARVALSDVTSQINKTNTADTNTIMSKHSQSNTTGPVARADESYSEDGEQEPNEDEIEELGYVVRRASHVTISSSESSALDAAPLSPQHEAACNNDGTSSLECVPLQLLVTEDSRRTVRLAYEKLHRNSPDLLDEDTYDVVMVAEYVDDIFDHIKYLEQEYKPDGTYMNSQPELKWSYRATLLDWLVQVHSRFQLLPETLYLTVNIIDRFLSKKTVTLNRFQLVGAAALFIAAKFEEINCPSLKEILYMLDNAYSREELLKAESFMIDTLGFDLGWPGPMSFLRRVSKADDYEYDIRTLAKYLLETTIMDPRLVSALPSWLAAGAYYLSKIILKSHEWTCEHIFYSGYAAEQLIPLATLILGNCRLAMKRHQAVFEKYSERRHRRSAQVVERWIALAEQRPD